MKIKSSVLLVAGLLFCFNLFAQLVRPGVKLHREWSISAEQNILSSNFASGINALCGYSINPVSSNKSGFLSFFDMMSEDTVAYTPYNSLNTNVFYSVAICDGSAMSTTPVVCAGYEEVTPGDRDILIHYADVVIGVQPEKSVNDLIISAPFNQEAKFIKQAGYGSYNFWTCGYKELSTGNKDFWFANVFADGSASVQWDTTFGGAGNDVANSLFVTMNTSLFIIGYTDSSPALGKDFNALIYMPMQDTILENNTFYRTGDQELNDIIWDDMYYKAISVGYSDTTGTNKDFLIVCFDQNTGDTIWTKTYGTPYDDVAFSVKMVDFGGMANCYAVAGYTTSEDGDKNNYMVLIDQSGNVISERIFGDMGVDESTNTMFSDYDVFYLFGNKGNNQAFNELAKFDYNIETQNVSCNGMNDGGITFYNESGFAMGVADVYLYDSDNNSVGSGDYYYDLSPGKYYVEFYYTFGAKASSFMRDSVVIGEPAYLDATISSIDPDCVGNLGSVSIAPYGGTPPYSLSWSNGENNVSQIDSLVAGYYEVFVSDANSCSSSSGWYGVTLYNQSLALIYGYAVTDLGLLGENHGKAILYKIENTGTAAELDSITSSTIDLNYQYTFNSVEPGDYKILIQIDSTSYYPNYLNSYYSLNDSVITWETADTIGVVCDDYFHLDVKMYEMTPMINGIGSISGFIYMYTYTKAVGEPVPGAEILIEQEPNDVPVQCAYTGEDGYYEVNGLETGSTYSMQVQIPGYPMINTYTNLPISNTDTVYEYMNFYVDTTLNGGIMADTLQTQAYTFTNEKFNLNAYPNPFNSSITFDVNLARKAFVYAEILNMAGESVQILMNEKHDEGNFEIKWQPKAQLISGVYFLRARVDNQVLIKKVVYTK